MIFQPWTQHSSSKTEANKHKKGRSVSRDVDVEQGHVRGGSNGRSWWRSIYQRVSQSGGDDEQEKYLSPHPKRKSVSRPKDPVQALPLIQETPTGGTGYAYEDPPPPSTLGAYRSSRFANNERKIPRKAPPRVSPPTSDFAHQSTEPAKPKANPPAQLGRSDSLLGRVFAYLGSDAHATNTDLDHGTESQPSRPTSLWKAGSVTVVPTHVRERSTVNQVNVSYGIDPRPVAPARGDVAGTGGIPGQGEETPAPQRSHIRDGADHFVTPPQPFPVVDHPPVRHDSPANPVPPPQPPGIPEPSAGYDLSFPLLSPRAGHVDPRTTHPFQMPDPRSRSPPQQYPLAGPSPPSNLARPRRISRNETLLRPFPEPVHRPPNVGPTKFTPSRSELEMPVPLVQPLPRGSGSLKRNRMNTLPHLEQHVPPNDETYRESRSRRHSQPIPVPRQMTNPNYVSHPPNSSSGNPHRRTSQPLPVLQETTHVYTSPPSSPPQRSSRRLSSPLMSATPHRPARSNAVHRKSPGSRSPARATSPRMNLLAELRGAPPMDSVNFSRYPLPGPGSGASSPPIIDRTRSSPTPRTPPFVNTHMLPSPTNSSPSDTDEWASAVSSLPPSVRTRRP